MSYCDVARGHPFHGPYHDLEYGFSLDDDDALFERLVLEINQAGLSWLTILKKRDAFRAAFDDFHVARVARFTERRREGLMRDAGIIRNRQKINAAVENARRIVAIQKDFGSFRQWLEFYAHYDQWMWINLFRRTFVFTGREITTSFLISIGYLPGAHDESCPVFKKIAKLQPVWMR